MIPSSKIRRRVAHTLMELVVAMAASTFLVAGMGSVMFIARQIAYTPTESSNRSVASDQVSQICDELRYATAIIQQTSQILEFVVADRNNDGTAEKIRYEWSGVAGGPLMKSVNGGASVNVIPAINSFFVTLQQTPKTTSYPTIVDSADQLLLITATAASGSRRDIDTSNFLAQVISPTLFSSIPANAISWTCSHVDFYGQQNGSATETMTVSIRPTGEPYDNPTSSILGYVVYPESLLTSSDGWNTASFPTTIRDLSLARKYALVFSQASGTGQAAKIVYNDTTASNVYDSTDGGASWQYQSTRRAYARIYGSYTSPGTPQNVTRNYVSSVRIALQVGSQGYSRVDASAPLRNLPELLTSYWRTDFDRSPTATNMNGDGVADWAMTSGTFDTSRLSNGVWNATGAIESRPLADFTTITTVEVRCRNTSVGGNGAVMRINSDRQGGTYGPIVVYIKKQSDGTQTLVLGGKPSDALVRTLFTRTNLSSGFIRYKLTVFPASNLVNIQINGEDQGTYSYPVYTPSSSTDRYCTVYSDTSTSEFDYVDVRVGVN